MSQSEKAFLYRSLKEAGVEFEKHYREYSTEDLQKNYDALVEAGAIIPGPPVQDVPLPGMPADPYDDGRGPGVPPPDFDAAATREALAAFGGGQPDAGFDPDFQQLEYEAPKPQVPVAPRDPNEAAGIRQNSHNPDQPIRIDPETGLIWYQEEIKKPAFPAPRTRRVQKYMEHEVRQESIKVGDYVETFEVSGQATGRTSEIKTTLPSYQVGIYKDPKIPFKVHVYNDVRGFDFFDVQQFYGGADLVPTEIKRMYVANDLCYDIRTTIRAIESEARRLQLQGVIQ